ncbi:hypothetical protein AB0L14_30950 [Streptomyces sp. NPDC052727]
MPPGRRLVAEVRDRFASVARSPVVRPYPPPAFAHRAESPRR